MFLRFLIINLRCRFTDCVLGCFPSLVHEMETWLWTMTVSCTRNRIISVLDKQLLALVCFYSCIETLIFTEKRSAYNILPTQERFFTWSVFTCVIHTYQHNSLENIHLRFAIEVSQIELFSFSWSLTANSSRLIFLSFLSSTMNLLQTF